MDERLNTEAWRGGGFDCLGGGGAVSEAERSKRSFIPALAGAAALIGSEADSKSPNPLDALVLRLVTGGCDDGFDAGVELKKSPPALAVVVCKAAGVDF